MARPIEEILQELKELYGPENSQPIINAIETRERYRQIHQRFTELKKQYSYKECVRKLVDEFHVSESLAKKAAHRKFPSS